MISHIWLLSFHTRSANPKLSNISRLRHWRPSAWPLNTLVPLLSMMRVPIWRREAHVAAIRLCLVSVHGAYVCVYVIRESSPCGTGSNDQQVAVGLLSSIHDRDLGAPRSGSVREERGTEMMSIMHLIESCAQVQSANELRQLL